MALKIEREEMLRVMHEEHPLAAVFIQFLLARGMRIQSDLVDQLSNSSEKRLARTLLLMAEIAETGEAEKLIPEISEDSLAEIIGSTKALVSFFLNRFRDLGLIEYNGRIRVHRSLLNVILHDQFPDDNAVKPPIIDVLKKLTSWPNFPHPSTDSSSDTFLAFESGAISTTQGYELVA
jgi:hypothetical protein